MTTMTTTTTMLLKWGEARVLDAAAGVADAYDDDVISYDVAGKHSNKYVQTKTDVCQTATRTQTIEKNLRPQIA